MIFCIFISSRINFCLNQQQFFSLQESIHVYNFKPIIIVFGCVKKQNKTNKQKVSHSNRVDVMEKKEEKKRRKKGGGGGVSVKKDSLGGRSEPGDG